MLAIALVWLVSCAPTPTAPSPAVQQAERAFAITRANAPVLMASGEGRLVALTLKNLGAARIEADGGVTYRWEGPGDPLKGDREPLPVAVPPGASVDLVVPIVAPLTVGSYTLVWSVVDSSGTFEAQGDARTRVEVRAPDARAN